jgi:hypothetical protein
MGTDRFADAGQSGRLSDGPLWAALTEVLATLEATAWADGRAPSGKDVLPDPFAVGVGERF